MSKHCKIIHIEFTSTLLVKIRITIDRLYRMIQNNFRWKRKLSFSTRSIPRNTLKTVILPYRPSNNHISIIRRYEHDRVFGETKATLYTEEPLTGKMHSASPLVTRSRPRLWFVDLDHRAGVNLRGVQHQALPLPTGQGEPSTSLAHSFPGPMVSHNRGNYRPLVSRLLRIDFVQGGLSIYSPGTSYQPVASLAWLIRTWTRD